MAYKLTISQMDNAILKLVNDGFKIYAPVKIKEQGRFSDTDLVKYASVLTFSEIETELKSSMSPKEVVFPPRETMFYFTENDYKEPEVDTKPIIIFLRACDANGILRLDKIFLENGTCQDPYYKRLRERISFFLIECTNSYETCFCVSSETNIFSDFSVGFKRDTKNVLLEVKDDKFKTYFASGERIEYTPKFIMENKEKVKFPDPEKLEKIAFDKQIWSDYFSRCIACGRCNTSCVTCSCFSSFDIFYDENEKCGERCRVWDGCHIDGFCTMAGGHDFRKGKDERMRFKTLHKIYDFKKRFGVNMCVGCGRCDDVCPEYISFINCINMLYDITDLQNSNKECDL